MRFFLQTDPKPEVEAEPIKDLEGHHSKLLLEAKKEGALEEQILNLHIISYHYIEKEEFITGSKILNAALSLLYQLPEYTYGNRLHIFEKYTLHRLEQIEAQFLASKGLKTSLSMPPLTTYRIQLKGIRLLCSQAHSRGQDIQEILFTLTKGFKELLGSLITDVQQILGLPPVKWAAMGMGSMSRDEMCPYSDVEFAFLVELKVKKL